MIHNRMLRRVYVIEFSDDYVYVGLSCNPRRRLMALTCASSKSSVKAHIDSNLGITWKFRTLTEFMPLCDGAESERFYISQYREQGYSLLNITPGGEIGGGKAKWIKEDIHKKSIKFSCRGSFYQYNTREHSIAHRNGFLDEICSHMDKKEDLSEFKNYWSKEICQSDVLNFNSEAEYELKMPTSYAAAKRYGWLADICSHMNTSVTIDSISKITWTI